MPGEELVSGMRLVEIRGQDMSQQMEKRIRIKQ